MKAGSQDWLGWTASRSEGGRTERSAQWPNDERFCHPATDHAAAVPPLKCPWGALLCPQANLKLPGMAFEVLYHLTTAKPPRFPDASCTHHLPPKQTTYNFPNSP